MHPVVVVVGIVAALGIALLVVHLSLTWADRRGWVWYRNPERGRPTSLGLIEEIYQPSVEHTTQMAIDDETLADQADSGEGKQDEAGNGGNNGP